ncbi:peptidyl-prolyl cis-trans isomerase FKBP4-like [Chelonus insularis]|uniref:peptidyl-prolyl cis-trans isomerase FKBP4-like n=1 Tax=Chelonus insularis TaxID=460826 RepID=UPI00158E1585|nr:peptidyl-prolyl cis-trans isomerase FKBP4-like [Chelonus insularis]
MNTKYISTDELVKKRVITHGSVSNKPVEGSRVHLFIEDLDISNKIDLNEFHSEILNGKSNVIITVDEILSEIDRQIERAIKWMGENETAIINITLPSLLPKIEECNESIQFKATVIKHEPFKPIWEWTPEEKYERAAKYKEMAVELVRQNRIKDAFNRFSKAVKIIISLEPIDDLELNSTLYTNLYKLRTSIYNNMAICQLKFNNYDHTINLCTKVLNRDKNNVKAMYRRGCAFGGNKNVEQAMKDFERIVHIEPTNFAAREKLKIYSELWSEAKKRSDELLKKMFPI